MSVAERAADPVVAGAIEAEKYKVVLWQWRMVVIIMMMMIAAMTPMRITIMVFQQARKSAR